MTSKREQLIDQLTYNGNNEVLRAREDHIKQDFEQVLEDIMPGSPIQKNSNFEYIGSTLDLYLIYRVGLTKSLQSYDLY